MNDVETGERECVDVSVSAVRGWLVREADAGCTGEREEVRLVRVLAWADEARNAGGDTPFVQCRRAFVLEERDGGEDGVREGRVEEADEGVGLFVGNRKGGSSARKENEGIWEGNEW
jgi:hypothetical protein